MQISVWEKDTFFAPQDVIIIGSGFVGLWSAYYLKKKYSKMKVTLLEKGVTPTGASSRNAGFACFGSLSEVAADAKQMGVDSMLQLVEMRRKGLQRIQKTFNSKLIDFDLCGGYELYNNSTSTEALQHDIEYINSLIKIATGAKQTYQLEDAKIKEFGFGETAHLVKNSLEGYLHPGKLLQHLLQLVQQLGVQVFTSADVTGFEKTGYNFELHTTGNIKFTARQLLFCTNAFTKNFFPELDVVPARGQILLTSPIKNLPWKGTFHADEGFYYFRNLGHRVLLGGARNQAIKEETTTLLHTSDVIQQTLENYLANVVLPGFKDAYVIEQRWAGIMAMGQEKSPIIKELQPGVFCAVRMSGMGVALAPVVARQVIKKMLA